MRDQKESTKIVTQLEGEFKKINIKIKGIQIKSEIILSSITFEKEKNPDMKSFLKQVQDNLKKKMLNTQND